MVKRCWLVLVWNGEKFINFPVSNPFNRATCLAKEAELRNDGFHVRVVRGDITYYEPRAPRNEPAELMA